jgi:TPR repeat protein
MLRRLVRLAALLAASCAHADSSPSTTALNPAQRQDLMQGVADFNNGDYKDAAPIFTALVKLGSARAETDLGWMYYCGCGEKPDQDYAFYLQTLSTAQGYGKGENNLGRMYSDAGIDDKAFHWFSLAAGTGDDAGEANLAWAYEFGRGTGKNDALAIHWFERSAKQQNPEAELALGNFYYDGHHGLPQSDAQAMALYRLAVKNGEPSASCDIADMYRDGSGVLRDDHRAMQWYQYGAKQDEDCAYVGIGFLYDQALGVKQDYGQAMKYYLRAAEDGDAVGENDVGAMYHRGAGGIPQDYGQAAHWFGLAADQHEATAEANLATLYTDGLGVPQNFDEALLLDQDAASQNEPHAQEQLGNIYLLGRGVPRDDGQAAKYYQLAADQGLPDAGATLAYLLATGQGVQQDYTAAYKWSLISAALSRHPILPDDDHCREDVHLPVINMADITSHLSPAQISAARAAATAWLATKIPPTAPDRPAWENQIPAVALIVFIYALVKTNQVRRVRQPAPFDQ